MGNRFTQQQGSTLIVALIMLLLVTLLAMSSMEDSMMQHQMARNLEDRKIAFESAEKALDAGEQYLQQPQNRTFAGNDPIDASIIDDWYGTGNVFAIDKANDKAADMPSYQIGQMRCVETAMQGCPVEMFTVAAQGVGGETQTNVYLMSRFARIQE